METVTKISRFSGMPIWLTRLVLLIATIPMLGVLLWVEENWRGRRAWEQYKHELAARGEPVEWAAFAPPEVPDEQNIFQSPKMSDWFVGRNYTDFSRRLNLSGFKGSPQGDLAGVLAEVTVLPGNTRVAPETADIVLRYNYSTLSLAAAQGDATNSPVVPLIAIDSVPLSDVIKALARQANVNYIRAPDVSFTPPGPTGEPTPEPLVSVRWTNITAQHALAAVLKNYNLLLRPNPATGIARLEKLDNNQKPRLDTALRKQLAQLVADAVDSGTNGLAGPAVNGVQGYQIFFAQPLNPVKPLRVVVLSDEAPDGKEIAEFFPKDNLRATPAPVLGNFQAESVAANSFRVRLNPPQACAAADYLAWSDQFEPDFDLIRTALQRPFAQMDGDYHEPFDIPIPNYTTIRILSQTLAQRAQCDLLLGQPEKALRELTLLHGLSRLLEGRPSGRPMTLVSAMINVAITGIYTGTVAEGLQSHAWHEPQLAVLQEQLREVNLPPQVAEAFRTQRSGICQLLADGTATSIGRLVNPVTPPIPSPLPRNIRQNLIALLPRAVMYHNMLTDARIMQGFIETYDPAQGTISPAKAALAQAAAEKIAGHPSPYTFIAAIAIPNFTRAMTVSAHNQTVVNEALVACALERYHLVHGDYPETLAALQPDLLKTIPHEVINSGALKYRRADNGQFLLYSVGWNMKDDGGTVAMTRGGKTVDDTQGDWVWPQYSAK